MRLVTSILAMAVAVAAAPAWAVSYVHFSLGGAHTAEFDIVQSPTPNSYSTLQSFVVDNVAGTFDGVAETRSLRFFKTSFSGGFQVIDAFIVNGAELYSGTEAAPTFLTGDYSLSDYFTRRTAGLAIYPTSGPVPEPASWAMLLTGFALIGTAARRRRTAAASSSYHRAGGR